MSSAPAAPTGDDAFAARLRGFGPVGILTSLGVLLLTPLLQPIGAVVPLLWAWRSRTPWRELGLVRPRSWLITLGLGVPSGVAFKLFMKSIVMPLLGAPALNPAFQQLHGNAAALPGMLFMVIVGAGIGEELLYRGFLFARLRALLGRSARAMAGVVAGTALYFGLIHLPEQGLAGAEQAAIMALVVGTIYGWTGQLAFPMVLHSAFNVTAVLLIYLGLEAQVAHWVFK
jgi:membrane protease YdiL (CAAX protease family)